MKEALLYSKIEDNKVRCRLCRHNCVIKDNERGICMVRENKGGKLFFIFYGRPCALAMDPIEKKPLFHFLPGTRSFSIATLGCNFQCEFCQNWDISQYGRAKGLGGRFEGVEDEVSPDKIVQMAAENNCRTISYTYSEPTIFYEYAKDIAILAASKDIKSIFVTNGYMSREMIDDMGPLLSAANIDLKAFSEASYRKIMKASLSGVLDSIAHMKKKGIWIEVTTLVVPNMNDSRKELKDIADFIAGIGKDIPWHISRFHPQYKMSDVKVTPVETLKMAYDIGKKAGLKYVYLGNIEGDDKENTFCWNCGKLLIKRLGFTVESNDITSEGKCPKCGSKIDGVFYQARPAAILAP